MEGRDGGAVVSVMAVLGGPQRWNELVLVGNSHTARSL